MIPLPHTAPNAPPHDQARLGCAWLREFVLRGHTRDQ